MMPSVRRDPCSCLLILTLLLRPHRSHKSLAVDIVQVLRSKCKAPVQQNTIAHGTNHTREVKCNPPQQSQEDICARLKYNQSSPEHKHYPTTLGAPLQPTVRYASKLNEGFATNLQAQKFVRHGEAAQSNSVFQD